MNYTLRWTPESTRTLGANLNYLAQEWGNQVAIDFLDRVEESLKMVKENPKLYPLHRPKDNVRKCIINKRIILYYKLVDEQFIDLLTFWNTYQNPDKLKNLS